MKNFLQTTEPLLPAAQLERIASIVATKQRLKEVVTPEEAQLELQRLLQSLQKSQGFQPAFRKRLPQFSDDIIAAEDINAMMEELDIDLGVLYNMSNSLTSASKGQQKIMRNGFESIRAKICRLSDEILSYRKLKNSTSFARIITQGYASGQNHAASGLKARVDQQTRTLKLPIVAQRRHHQERGLNPAQVSVTNLSTGVTGVSSRTFEPENAIDPDEETFWADVIVAESPIQTEYSTLGGVTSTYDGALVEFRMILGSPEAITDVKVLPFGEYPISVVDVKYRQGTTWFEYPGFVSKSPSLNWLEWIGPRVIADEIAFVLQQETYNRRVYHIPKSLLEISTFWEQLLDEQSQLTVSDEFLSEFQQARAVADSRASSMYEAMRRYQIELERLDIPSKDPDARTVSETDVLRLETEATAKAMYSDKSVGIALRPHTEEVDTTEELVSIERIEYVLGAREIQANTTQYVQMGFYSSPQYRPDSTLLNIQVEPVEEHPEFSDAAGSYRLTSIEYDVEIAPGRRIPIAPKGATEIKDELLVLDRTSRTDTTRLQAAGVGGASIRKDGVKLDPGNYTLELLSTGFLRVTVNASAFVKNSRYSITYVPATGQDSFDIEALYDSVRLERPERFSRTDDDGSVTLQYYPYVEYSIVNNEDDFKREATRSARWVWVGNNKQVVRDGSMFGDINTTLAADVSSSDTTIDLTSSATVQSTDLPAKLRIGDEIVQYTGVSTNTLTGVTRGLDSTTAQAHSSGARVSGLKVYEPIVVTVGGIRASNITDYLGGVHPAFLATQEASQRFEYLHIGNKLFFNRPILTKPIVVQYGWMAQYIQLHALLRSHTVGSVPYSPALQRFHLEIESTVL